MEKVYRSECYRMTHVHSVRTCTHGCTGAHMHACMYVHTCACKIVIVKCAGMCM